MLRFNCTDKKWTRRKKIKRKSITETEGEREEKCQKWWWWWGATQKGGFSPRLLSGRGRELERKREEKGGGKDKRIGDGNSSSCNHPLFWKKERKRRKSNSSYAAQEWIQHCIVGWNKNWIFLFLPVSFQQKSLGGSTRKESLFHRKKNFIKVSLYQIFSLSQKHFT